MKFLKRLALLTLIFTMCVSITTYACPTEKPDQETTITNFDEVEDNRNEFF